MSLYNMLFGVNKLAPVLLAALGIKHEDVPRFRDCYISNGEIIIHTRTGGGNREEYSDGNALLAANKFYISDEDCDFDSTYANFHFRFPEEYAADLKAISEQVESATPSEKWEALLKGLSDGTIKE